MRPQAIIVTVFLILHHAVAVMHGGVHTALEIFLPAAKNSFVIGIIIVLPILAVILVWTQFATAGLLVLMICMAGALVFDVYHHYILVSPDNIAHLPQGAHDQHAQFVWTAHALAVLQITGTGLAAYLLGARRAS